MEILGDFFHLKQIQNYHTFDSSQKITIKLWPSHSKSPHLIKNISRVNSSRFFGPTAGFLIPHVELGLSRQKLMMISHCFKFNTNTYN